MATRVGNRSHDLGRGASLEDSSGHCFRADLPQQRLLRRHGWRHHVVPADTRWAALG